MLTALAVEQVEVQKPRIHTWTREEYYRLAELGLFDGRRVELIEGVIIDMGAIGTGHATAVTLVSDTLRDLFRVGWVVRVQAPLSIEPDSDPQPDVLLVAGKVRDFREFHPTTAALIVEVSDTTVKYDREIKSSLYAKANVQEYWLLNIQRRQLEVRRSPQPDPDAPSGYSYASTQYYKSGDFVSPLAKPEVSIPVADLLP